MTGKSEKDTKITGFVWPDTINGHLGLWLLGGLIVFMGVVVSSSELVQAVGWGEYRTQLGTLWLGLLATHLFEYFHDVIPILREFGAPKSVYIAYFVATFVSGFGAWLPLKAKAEQLKPVKEPAH